MTARVLIVDDHPLTREALAGLLGANDFDVVGAASGGAEALAGLLGANDFDVVGAASGGAEAVELAAKLQPDLVVLDLTMPEVDGLTALPKVLEAAPETAVVMLTASEDDGNLLAAIRLGAAGYLLKNEPPDRIVGFLRGVVRGEAALSGAVARSLFEQVREGGQRSGVVPQSIADVVSARELEVLLLLDQHLRTDEIATRLFISEHTVRSHVKSLLAKLNVSSRREALEKLNTARRS